MRIQNSFDVAVPVPQAWELLTDIEEIAPCMPGAELTEVLDGDAYRGNVTVRLGPVTLTFDGTARFDEMDSEAYQARVSAQGTDSKGRGGATADMTFRLEPTEQGTKVVIDTDLNLSGSVAQYGRGAGMINELANHLVGRFAESLHEKIAVAGQTSAPGIQDNTAAAAAAPISGFGLVARTVWSALIRGLRRIFSRT
ncbi:MAG: SRPBCC family protein [Alphaproteobacteria bacterium]|nr:SRPBCC family protein [Alphaproteobacteria bacterium]MCY4498536.1 SRPBCC family protein [Rhodospirillaceae bacterium]